MTRISRISTPRATLGAFALLVIAIAGFGLFADGGEKPAHSVHAANEVELPATGTSQHCSTPRRGSPDGANDRRPEDHRDVQV